MTDYGHENVKASRRSLRQGRARRRASTPLVRP